MNRFSLRGAMLLSGVVASFSTFGAGRVSAQPGQNGDGPRNDGPPVYQQHPTDGHQRDGHPFDKRRRDDRRDRRDFRRGFPFVSPQTSSAWFQRPYPYHLDYYKMRYGGSYAPYFGNLYGPSGFPAYYGPYYGGYGGYDAGYANGYPQPGYNGVPMEYPATAGAEMPEAGVEEVPLPAQVQPGAAKASGGAVPAATP